MPKIFSTIFPGGTAYWTEIVRRMQPQKLVTTEAVNALGEKVKFRACSRPTKEAEAIYRALGMRPAPFIKAKSVVHRNRRGDA